MDQQYLGETLKYKQSIAAVNDKGEILAIRLGNKKTRYQRMEKFIEWLLLSTFKNFSFLMPQSLKKSYVFIKVLEEVGFDTWKMFDELNCDSIYEDKAVCSSRKHGIK